MDGLLLLIIALFVVGFMLKLKEIVGFLICIGIIALLFYHPLQNFLLNW